METYAVLNSAQLREMSLNTYQSQRTVQALKQSPGESEIPGEWGCWS